MMRVTLRDIAKAANVSHVTVSLALRNRSEISVETRDKIRKLARKMGYVPDPALGRLNAYRRTAAHKPAYATIAWVNLWEDPKSYYRNPTYSQYRMGADNRAKELGYRIEEFCPLSGEVTQKRLNQILESRGINGLILPPVPRGDRTISLNWKKFCVVRIGYSLQGHSFNVVSNAQFGTAFDATIKLAQKKLLPIGWTFCSHAEDRTVSHFLGGYQAALHKCGLNTNIPPFIFESTSKEESRSAFVEWYSVNRPRAILVQDAITHKWLTDAKVRIPEDVALIHLALPVRDPINFTGMHQDSMTIGAQSVNLLDRMIRHEETGIPEVSVEVQIKSKWIDGETS